MDEGADVTSQLQDSADEGKEIPIHAKEVIEALQDLEDEYDLHPKHAVKNKSWKRTTSTEKVESTDSHGKELGSVTKLWFFLELLFVTVTVVY